MRLFQAHGGRLGERLGSEQGEPRFEIKEPLIEGAATDGPQQGSGRFLRRHP